MQVNKKLSAYVNCYTLNSDRNYTLRANTQYVGGLRPQTDFPKRSIGEFQKAVTKTRIGVLAPLHFEYSHENKVYSFFWSWVYVFEVKGYIATILQ